VDSGYVADGVTARPAEGLCPTGVAGLGLVTPSYLALRRILGVTRWLYRWAAMMALVLDTRLTAGGDPVDVVNAACSNTEVPQLVQVDASGPDVWHRLHSWDLGRGTHVQRFEGTGLRVSRRRKHLRLAAPERIALSIQYENPAWFATGRDSGHAIDPGQLHLVAKLRRWQGFSAPRSGRLVISASWRSDRLASFAGCG